MYAQVKFNKKKKEWYITREHTEMNNIYRRRALIKIEWEMHTLQFKCTQILYVYSLFMKNIVL